MDIVRLGRELSADLAAIGVPLFLLDGLFILLSWFRLIAFTYEFLLLVWILLFIGLMTMTFGGVYWVAYLIEEWQEFRKLTPLIDQITQSKTVDLSMSPAFLLDSVDRELLQIVKEAGGDILSMKNQLKRRALALDPKEQRQRVAGLLNIKMIRLHKKKIGLTPIGHEAIVTPSAVFTSRIPTRVRQHLYDAKRALFLENWGQCVLDCHKAIEAAYKQLIREAAERDKEIQKRVDQLAEKGRPIEKRGAGELHGIMVETKQLKSRTFECWLSDEVTRYRPKSHDVESGKPFSSEDAYRCELYTGILMRNLYT